MPRASTFRPTAGLALTLLWVPVLVLVASGAAALEPGEFDPMGWDALLKKYVADGRVDYAAWKSAGTANLDAVLDSMAVYDPTSVLGKEPRAGFWLNAYHAWAIRQILEHYPVASVKEIPGFYDENARRIGGEDLTLNGIESLLAEILPNRPEFALSLCKGTAGGPPLRDEAFTSQNLAKLFDLGVEDAFKTKRIHYDESTNILHYPPEVVAYLPMYQALPQGIVAKFGAHMSLGTVMAINSKKPEVVTDPVDEALNGLPPRSLPEAGKGAP